MPVRVQRHQQVRRRRRDAWPQGHVRAACIIMGNPSVQQVAQVAYSEWDETIEALLPERAQEPLAQRIGLRTPHRGLEHPEPEVPYALVELLRENAVAVVDEEAIAM